MLSVCFIWGLGTLAILITQILQEGCPLEFLQFDNSSANLDSS